MIELVILIVLVGVGFIGRRHGDIVCRLNCRLFLSRFRGLRDVWPSRNAAFHAVAYLAGSRWARESCRGLRRACVTDAPTLGGRNSVSRFIAECDYQDLAREKAKDDADSRDEEDVV